MDIKPPPLHDFVICTFALHMLRLLHISTLQSQSGLQSGVRCNPEVIQMQLTVNDIHEVAGCLCAAPVASYLLLGLVLSSPEPEVRGSV